MNIKWSAIIAGILVVWYKIKRILDELSKILEPVIKEVEKLALDGVIDRQDRKKVALKLIETLEKEGKIKLNFITRFILSFIIDKIAKKLPDFVITKEIKELTSAEKLKTNGILG